MPWLPTLVPNCFSSTFFKSMKLVPIATACTNLSTKRNMCPWSSLTTTLIWCPWLPHSKCQSRICRKASHPNRVHCIGTSSRNSSTIRGTTLLPIWDPARPLKSFLNGKWNGYPKLLNGPNNCLSNTVNLKKVIIQSVHKVEWTFPKHWSVLSKQNVTPNE